MYMVVPQAAAVRGNVTPQLGNSTRALPPGFSVQIVPLRYVGVREMLRLLEPFAKDAQAVRPDELRNLLILSGTERELKHLMDTIDMFDIDWMAGMSAGVFTLQNSDVKSVMTELEKIVGDRNTSPLTGILKIVPIERMNALLVVSPQAALRRRGQEVDRPPRQGRRGRRTAVLRLQPAELARRTTGAAAAAGVHRPGDAVGGSDAAHARARHAGGIDRQPAAVPGASPALPVANPTPPAAAAAVAAAAGCSRRASGIVRNLQVVADKDNNTLLFVATPAEYSIIETALKKLDIPQRQVIIDVTIAQVVLTDQMDFGVEWLFKGGAPSGRGSGGLLSGNILGQHQSGPQPHAPAATDSTAATLVKGFTYIINNSNFPGGVQAALSLLDTYGNTKIVANPQVAALDNQKATIKSGERIPVFSADAGRRHHQRRHDDVAVHRHRRAAAGDAAHQRGRARRRSRCRPR